MNRIRINEGEGKNDVFEDCQKRVTLEDQGVNKIIMVSHVGYYNDIVLAKNVPGLNIIVEGTRVEVSSEVEANLLAAISSSPLLTLADEDPDVDALLAPYRNQIDAAMGVPIGTISETMENTRIPASFAPGEIPTGSYAAQVVCDAFMQANPKIDFAIQNTGGVRGPLIQGDFTIGDAINVLPFSNTVVMLDMTGAQIRKVLNESTYYALNSGSSGAFPMLRDCAIMCL